ncbi:MAG TPA: amidohydrolase family protein [Sphingomicrobium sp.]|nr:amidohydrolase family protein [Sphingomicrobium sp.]
MRSSFLLLAVSFLLIGAAPYEPPHAGTRTAYRHASLIDGTGAAMRRDVAVVTDGERIVAVEPDGSLNDSQLQGATQVDLGGKYLLPGYIDSHQHLATPPDRPEAEARLKRDIYSGITGTRDMADDIRQIADITRAARVGEIPSPDINYAALMAGSGFFKDPRTEAIAKGAVAGEVPWEQAIDQSTNMILAVARAKGTYATAVKVYADLPGDLVAKITSEAHRQGMRVWAHGMVFPATPFEVVDAGVDTVSHTCYLAYQAMAKRPDAYEHRFPIDPSLFTRDNPVMAKLYADMARRGTILDATLHVYREVEEGARQQHKPPLCTVAFAGKLTNQAWRAGVRISTGTDGDTPVDEPWPSLFDEFQLLHDAAGLPPMAVIQAATITGAKAMGADQETGTIVPGKLANMVVLSANPLDDVRNMRTVVMTVKRGRQFLRSDYKR